MKPCVCILVLLLTVSASADELPDYAASTASIPTWNGSIWVSPGGNGPDMAHGFGPSGEPADVRITLILIDGMGNPIANYPREDMWLVSAWGGLSRCPMGTAPDTTTDENGQTVFSGPFHAGGSNRSPEGIRVMISGSPLQSPALALSINSPDVNGDLVVNLSDVVNMAQALQSGYDWRYDFNNDGAINLHDIVVFAGSFGMHCGS